MLRFLNRLVHTPESGRPDLRNNSGGLNSCYPCPSWFLSAAPKGGSCGGMNRDQHSLNAAVAMERVIDYCAWVG
jgi:hypothetical protein